MCYWSMVNLRFTRTPIHNPIPSVQNCFPSCPPPVCTWASAYAFPSKRKHRSPCFLLLNFRHFPLPITPVCQSSSGGCTTIWLVYKPFLLVWGQPARSLSEHSVPSNRSVSRILSQILGLLSTPEVFCRDWSTAGLHATDHNPFSQTSLPICHPYSISLSVMMSWETVLKPLLKSW